MKIQAWRERSKCLIGTDKEYEAELDGNLVPSNGIIHVYITASGANRGKAIKACKKNIQTVINQLESLL